MARWPWRRIVKIAWPGPINTSATPRSLPRSFSPTTPSLAHSRSLVSRSSLTLSFSLSLFLSFLRCAHETSSSGYNSKGIPSSRAPQVRPFPREKTHTHVHATRENAVSRFCYRKEIAKRRSRGERGTKEACSKASGSRSGGGSGEGEGWRGKRKTTTKARRKQRVRMRMCHETRKARALKPP